MREVRTELVDAFVIGPGDGGLARSYLITGRDRITVEGTARALQKKIDGGTLTLSDGITVEAEGASIGIDQVRDVRTHLEVYPRASSFRTALVLQAELMTPEAQNALLKAAEEPGPRAVLLLATTDEERILPTLRSRLYRVAVPVGSTEEAAAWLQESRSVPERLAASVAGKSGGNLQLADELSQAGTVRKWAQELLTAAPGQVPAIAKEAAGDEIALRDLLRALAVELAYTERTARTHELWHRVQRLMAEAAASPLSLRLQIAALFADLPA